MAEAEVVVVGGGPAGAATAIRLASAGREVVLFERLAGPRWRACGVYSSPLTRGRLLDLGFAPADVGRLIRPISAMVVQTVDGRAACRLEYDEVGRACGIDRVRLERRLLELARRAGATVCEGTPVTEIDLHAGRPRLAVGGAGGRQVWTARLVVGADGPHSLVARSAGGPSPARHFRRAALTGHRADPSAADAGQPMEAEMIVGPGWYCGVAPVPGGRVNLGLVLAEEQLRAELRAEIRRPAGPAGVMARMVGQFPGPRRGWVQAPATDELQAALPLLSRPGRLAGQNFLLVGDAAGFVDPLSGEGLQRAFVSAQLAADAIARWSAGDAVALEAYARHMRARFRTKDALAWVLQLFLANPQLAGHAIRRLDRRPDLRRPFALGLADMLPASRLLDPRFVARLMAP